MASKGGGGDFNFKKDATYSRKQNRQEQKRQDHKARQAGKAERAADVGSAQYGDGSSASRAPRTVRRVPQEAHRLRSGESERLPETEPMRRER